MCNKWRCFQLPKSVHNLLFSSELTQDTGLAWVRGERISRDLFGAHWRLERLHKQLFRKQLDFRASHQVEIQSLTSDLETESDEERGKNHTFRTARLRRNQRSKPLVFQNKSSSRDPIVDFKSRNKQAPYPRSRPSEQVFWSNPEKPSHKSRIPHFPGQLQIVVFRPTTRTNDSLVTPFIGTFTSRYV